MRKGIIIANGIMKGGVGKTTTTAITGYLLAKMGKKVLLIDMDSQGNMSGLLTQRNIYDFTENTVLQAIKDGTVEPYIVPICDNLDLVPAEDFLALLPRWIYMEYRVENPLYFHENRHFYLLKDAIEPVRNQYDYILIDLPPSPGEPTQLSLVASDYALIMLQSEPFGLDALDRYLEIIAAVQKLHNPNLAVVGILTSLLDSRTSIDAHVLDEAKNKYDDWVFNTIIKRKTRIKEFTLSGITDITKADKLALEMYMDFVKELIARCEAE